MLPLIGDITGNGNPLIVSGNTTVTLDLDGHTIDRNFNPEVEVSGNAIRIMGGNLTLTDSSLEENGKITGGNSNGNGGGVFVDKGTFTMSGGNITGNKAQQGGGGVYVFNGTFTMTGGEICKNKAGGSGGGVYIDGVSFNMTDGYIGGNEAVEFGGGVAVHDGSFILGNGSDDSKHPAVQNNSARLGGGVYAQNAEFTMNKYTFIQYNNSTEHGGGVRVMGSGGESAVFNMYGGNICSNGSEYGGGVHVIGNGGTVSFNMTDGQINNNTATRDGGGIFMIAEYNEDYQRGGNAYFSFSNGEINGNRAGNNGGGIYTKTNGNYCWCMTNMTGGDIAYNQAYDDGGGAYIRSSMFTMNSGSISHNEAKGGYGGGYGGGVYVRGPGGGAAFTLKSGTIENNTAKYGGGVYARSEEGGKADFIMNGGDIRYNTATENGGGIGSSVGSNSRTRLILQNGNIEHNTARNGGGLYTSWNISMLKNVNIQNNTASANGGGAFINVGQLTVSGGTIVNNKAGKDGGGIYELFKDAAQFNISGNLAINGNTAASESSNVVMADNGETTDDKFKINILGKLDESTKIGIRTLFTETRKSKTAVVTKCLKGNGTLSNFIAEGDGTISINAAGELEYIAPCAHDGGFDIVGAKDPNCKEKGSTGEKHCKKCGALIEPAEEIAIDPDKHDYDEGEVTKAATRYETGETTYTCRRCGHKMTLANIPCTEENESAEDKQERDEDTRGADGKSLVESKKETDEKTGEETETVSVQGKEVSKIVTDPESGRETVESLIWIGGLSGNYTYTGSAVKPAFRVYDGMKKLVENTDYAVSYSANTDAGTAEITVKFKGNYKGTEPVKAGFTIDPAKLGTDVRAHDMGVVKKSAAQKPVPVVTFASTGKTINKKNFDISYDREVKDAGVYTATITPKNGNFTGTTTALIKVTDKDHLLENAKVTFNPGTYAYTGKEIVPDPSTITVKIGSNNLVFGRDVKIASIHNNIMPGNATVILEAISSNQAGYVGSKTTSFKIKGSREIKDETPFAITADKTVVFAKGGAKAAVTVMDGTTVLKNGKDYTLKYKKNKAVTTGETAEVTIKGKGNYKGSVTRKFAVTKQNLGALKANISVEDQFNAKSKLKVPSVTIIDTDGNKLAANKDYTVGKPDADRDPLNTEISGNAVVKVTGKGAYEGEVEVTFSYNKDSSTDLSKASAMKIADQTYTGGEIRLGSKDLENILYTGSKSSPSYLKPGTDFAVKDYTNNVKKGTAKVILKGQGSYAGKKIVSFKIKQKKGSFQGSLVGGEWK